MSLSVHVFSIQCRHLLTASLAAALLLAATSGAGASPEAVWADVAETTIPAAGQRIIRPDSYRIVAIDFAALGTELGRAPVEGTAGAQTTALVLELPLPDGSARRFAIVESPVMAPELGAKYPEIRTYLGRAVDDPGTTARLDRTPLGFHAMIFAVEGTIYIDPYQQGDVEHYIVYNKRDYRSPYRGDVGCQLFDEDGMAAEIRALVAQNLLLGHGTQLRTYRAAVAATGEYTIFHGGTVVAGMAAVTTAMNRVTGVYEREVSVRMQLIPNNNLIIYTNPGTDPYTNGDGIAMLSQNQSNLDAVIGSANYDIGHVFSTGGGGVASLAVVCRNGVKARGVTGLSSPIGDPFYIDYVAHEIGHQYGGNHTFNGNAGACTGGNRNAATAYEPGSGSTIMAYAGICSPQNLQSNSDDYFHWISIQEIVNYTTIGSGNSCPVVTNTGAVVPMVSAPPGGFTIPISTPFSLTATATTTGTATHCWEESDLGPAGHPNTPSGNAPIFRTFDPVPSPTRIFPRIQNILNNTQTIGEILPSYTRSLSFKVTVRDAQAGGVGVENASIAFSVTSAAGPFQITTPNSTGIQWPGGSLQTVSWNVAGTDLAPVNCQTVNILLSTDGGLDFTAALAVGTANDGSEMITVPNTPTTLARIKVEAADNVFFDINNFNVQILESAAVAEPVQVAAAGGVVLHECRPNPFNPQTTIAFELPSASRATLRVYDLAGRLVATLADGLLPAGTHSASWNGTDASGRAVASGIYLCELRAGAKRLTERMMLLK